MSWIFGPIQSDGADSSSSSTPSPEQQQERQQQSPTNRGGGVKDDLSVVGQTIGRRLFAVASFLAPPPSFATEEKPEVSDSPSSPSQALLGIRNDLAEFGGSLKSGLSLLSVNKTVCEISQLTSNFFSLENEGYVPGISREVVDFVREISLRPECWTDFPLPLENDFRMSESQKEHASTVEQMVPSLRALRTSICRVMGVEQFWMVYFILLLPRLNEHDFDVLSTPQIVEMRNVLLLKLKSKRNEKVEISTNSDIPDACQVGSKVGQPQEDSTSSTRKGIPEIVNVTEALEIDDEENGDRWLEDTDIETCSSPDKEGKLEDREDVSFSDLEDDNNYHSSRLSASGQVQGIKGPSHGGSSDWVQLNKNSGLQKARPSISPDKDSDIESNDWLKVDNFD